MTALEALWSEGAAVVAPCILTLGLMVWITAVRLKEVSASELLLDRKFLIGLAYSGALLAIYLSCLYLWRVASRG